MARKICQRCKEEKSSASYIAVNSIIHGGSLPICRQCLAKQIDAAYASNNGWNTVDKICQWADVPFIPEEWDKMYKGHGRDAIGVYISTFRTQPYETLDWKQYNEVYLQIQEENRIEDALPSVREHKKKQLRQKWGSIYDDEDMEYLENLHQGLIKSQNIVGALNEDQALKLCKISLIIEHKIRDGEEFTKDMKAYEDLAKLSNLTPKNVKDADEFSSFAEVGAYLEKTGWVCKYYDNAPRDEIDYVQKNIMLWNQYLYVTESGLAEEMEQRIQNLKVAAELEGEDFNEEELRTFITEQNEKVLLLDQENFKMELG